jgi:peptide/nickel transport system permease protein
MTLLLVKRFSVFVATLLVTSMLIFLVLEVLPGSAAQVVLGTTATPEAEAALNEKLGLDRPAAARYGSWLLGLATFDLGTSVAYDTPVASLLAERMAVSVPLAVMALVISSSVALVLGLYAAARHNQLGDVVVMSISQAGMAIPNFWLAILLVLLFAVKLRWLPAGGFPGWDEGAWPAFRSLLLPAVSLAAVQAAVLARVTRSSVLEVLREDFVRTARSKGLSRRAALWRHVLRNAMVPISTVMGLQFANLLTGTIVIENVFYLPGLGRLAFQAIANRDLVVVRNVIMLLAASVVLINFLVDVLHVVIDPRLKPSDL